MKDKMKKIINSLVCMTLVLLMSHTIASAAPNSTTLLHNMQSIDSDGTVNISQGEAELKADAMSIIEKVHDAYLDYRKNVAYDATNITFTPEFFSDFLWFDYEDETSSFGTALLIHFTTGQCWANRTMMFSNETSVPGYIFYTVSESDLAILTSYFNDDEDEKEDDANDTSTSTNPSNSNTNVTNPTTTNTTVSNWAKADVEEADVRGIVPDEIKDNYKQNITRQEFCHIAFAILSDIAKIPAGDAEIPFNDTTDDKILYIASLGIVNGTGKAGFNPTKNITRAEAAKMLYLTAMELGATEPNTSNVTFADDSSFANWARPFIKGVSSLNIMQGVGKNNFNATGTYTREQAVVTFNRIYSEFLNK